MHEHNAISPYDGLLLGGAKDRSARVLRELLRTLFVARYHGTAILGALAISTNVNYVPTPCHDHASLLLVVYQEQGIHATTR